MAIGDEKGEVTIFNYQTTILIGSFRGIHNSKII